MLKALIAATVLPLAGTVLAGAAEYTSETDFGDNGSGYAGFVANLSANIVKTKADIPEADEFRTLSRIALKSVTLSGRTKAHPKFPQNDKYFEFKIAVFATDTEGKVKGEWPSICGDFLGMSKNSGKLANGKTFTWIFENIELGRADAFYTFVFVPPETKTEAFRFGEWKTTQTAIATSPRDAEIGEKTVAGLYLNISLDGSKRSSGFHLPHFKITTVQVDDVPDPDVFSVFPKADFRAFAAAQRRSRRGD